jgi:hypothetical protein
MIDTFTEGLWAQHRENLNQLERNRRQLHKNRRLLRWWNPFRGLVEAADQRLRLADGELRYQDGRLLEIIEDGW